MTPRQATGHERLDEIAGTLMRLWGRGDIRASDKDDLQDAANLVMWDDAIHIAAPWEPRSSLCGNWNRNLVDLEDPRPGGMEGCWTCLLAAEWFDKQAEPRVVVV